MERHKCKLCTRSFSSGRALGGHMKGHLAAHPLPPKTTTLHQLSDRTESASVSSYGEELETKGKRKRKGQIPEVAEEKSLGYGLRNKPKKSFRFSDPEFSFAVDSGSVVAVVVQDRESETESRNPTRKRSNRNRKLSDRHQKRQQSLEIKKPKLKKPSCRVESPTEPEPVSSVSDTSPEEDVAMYLMMLSRDVWMRNNDDEEVGDQRDNVENVFRFYRGHKKVCEATKNAGKVNTDQKIFECPFCYKVFGSGQALGGHKRSHLLTNSSTPVVSHSVEILNNFIDLNLPAPLEDDDFSVVSYA